MIFIADRRTKVVKAWGLGPLLGYELRYSRRFLSLNVKRAFWAKTKAGTNRLQQLSPLAPVVAPQTKNRLTLTAGPLVRQTHSDNLLQPVRFCKIRSVIPRP